jgi:hypothetical protein
MNDQLVTEAATYITHKKYKRLIFILSAVFESAIPATELPQTYTLIATNIFLSKTTVLVITCFFRLLSGSRVVYVKSC